MPPHGYLEVSLATVVVTMDVAGLSLRVPIAQGAAGDRSNPLADRLRLLQAGKGLFVFKNEALHNRGNRLDVVAFQERCHLPYL